MSRPSFKIRLPAIGRGDGAQIVLDGEDITNKVSHVTIDAGVSQTTTVFLTYPAVDVEIEGEGEVIE